MHEQSSVLTRLASTSSREIFHERRRPPVRKYTVSIAVTRESHPTTVLEAPDHYQLARDGPTTPLVASTPSPRTNLLWPTTTLGCVPSFWPTTTLGCVPSYWPTTTLG